MEVRRFARRSMRAKKLLSVVRIALLMLRKELISKRMLMKELNMIMKRGKLIRKSLSNLLFILPHHHSKTSVAAALGMHGVQDYEFSYNNNTPNTNFKCPVFSYASSKLRKHHNLLPCINFPLVLDQHHLESTDSQDDQLIHDHIASTNNYNAVVFVPKTPEYQFNLNLDIEYDLAQGEQYSLLSPFHVKVSDYLSEDEDDVIGNDQEAIDYQAEEFIKRFYEQLRSQSRTQLLQY